MRKQPSRSSRINRTVVHAVLTGIGYPQVVWSDTLNGRRRYTTLYRRGKNGFYGDSVDPEGRAAVIAVLEQQKWALGRDCLATAPWLQQT